MKTLTLYLTITTLLLLIWMYQCFYDCDSYKTLIDQNILQTKNKLKYERALTEGDIAGKMQTYSEGCLEECPLDYEKNKWENPFQYENPYDRWQKYTTPLLRKLFNKETSKMDPIWRDQKWNNEWNKISANKVNDLSSIFHRSDISEEKKKELIRSVKEELHIEFWNFLKECKKEVRDNKTQSASKKEMIDNETESESESESESMREMGDNKTESESMKEARENRTESKFKKEMRENKTESESKKEQEKNKIKNKKSNIFKFLFKRFDNH
ncbi:fam-g protein [Plasmodium gallinaceum]|uniref:Fam-g protein n=1 Tax=Plasmodium gallinaceum TaxID=5849 RepID=A0A1J1GSK5_PLAGA|nr:fam-g protein [Plasmodium gallinaceum]CRG95466.1 fam-g protein [Plasmodium gallinaceum]